MKLRRVRLSNVRSFLSPAELRLDGDISVLIGPNGGGKTNLLDIATTALRRHLVRPWVITDAQENTKPVRLLGVSEAFDAAAFERHSDGAQVPQRIDIELEVTATDVDNMLDIMRNVTSLRSHLEDRYRGLQLRTSADWDPTDLLMPNQRLTYAIENGLLLPLGPREALFQRYLSSFGGYSILRHELDNTVLSAPMLCLPVRRAEGGFGGHLSLSNYQEADQRTAVDVATSRSPGSIFTLAVGQLAYHKRRLELENDTEEKFYSSGPAAAITRTLGSLGYGWQLKCTNVRSNAYELSLTKDGATFRLDAASSGEREILTYILGIYALDIRNALLVIDEPELHLHPRWQRTLFSLFRDLSRETGNQFLLASHSPVFIQPESIDCVTRVYSKAKESRIIRLDTGDLPSSRHLFSIVNSHNNERIFFADFVILVEGLSDKIVFEEVLRHFHANGFSEYSYEVVHVNGKGTFAQYQKLLNSSKVPHAVIADLDYLSKVGSEGVRNLFSADGSKIKTSLVSDLASLDGDSFVARIEEVIHGSSKDDLISLWQHIKANRRRLRDVRTPEEDAALTDCLENLRTNGVYILSKGALEAYLPTGHKSKNIDLLIDLVNTGALWERLEPDAQREFLEIVAGIQRQVAGSGRALAP